VKRKLKNNLAPTTETRFELSMPNTIIVAIDPGVSGGFAWHCKSKTYCSPMPEGDNAVASLIAGLSRLDACAELYLEQPPLFAGKNIPGFAVGKMMQNYGVCYGAASALGFKIHTVRPPAWQKTHSIGTKGELSTTEWKNKLKNRAAELFPQLTVTLKTADALLILDSALRKAIN
jgi:hypothetical protein